MPHCEPGMPYHFCPSPLVTQKRTSLEGWEADLEEEFGGATAAILLHRRELRNLASSPNRDVERTFILAG